MVLLLLEALGALLLLLLIVWWTMFSGRKQGELQHDKFSDEKSEAEGLSGRRAKKIDKIDR
jgi:hypothetical protein